MTVPVMATVMFVCGIAGAFEWNMKGSPSGVVASVSGSGLTSPRA